MPRVSVVMPVHAQAAWVPRAVGSLLAQDEEDWELVVVDDGSPDDVAAALPADPRISLLRLERNGGLGAALNAGLDRTTAASRGGAGRGAASMCRSPRRWTRAGPAGRA